MPLENAKIGVGRKQIIFLFFILYRLSKTFLVIEQKNQVLGGVYGVVTRGCLGILCDVTSLWVPEVMSGSRRCMARSRWHGLVWYRPVWWSVTVTVLTLWRAGSSTPMLQRKPHIACTVS